MLLPLLSMFVIIVASGNSSVVTFANNFYTEAEEDGYPLSEQIVIDGEIYTQIRDNVLLGEFKGDNTVLIFPDESQATVGEMRKLTSFVSK
jgi:hypothetical protein